MKIESNKDNKIETFGTKSEESFSIGDTGFILNLLRSQLYSNIIRTITQEYMCNARDAHREVGTPNKKIVVSLPSSFDPYWKVRDFGPGIDPDRMSNVFIQYGKSTKRGSNVETGGFGLGAKSGFGYKDSFLINTFINGTKRIYSAIIDETQQGVLQLMSESKTNEENGTEICIPVDPKDMTKFATETFSVLRHWKNRPEILNNSFSHLEETSKVDKMLSGNRWFLENSNRKMIYAVLDEVEYAIPDTMIDYNKVRVGNSKLYLEFKTGELEVAPNREQLKQSDSNKKKVYAILDKFEEDAKKELNTQLQAATSYVEAVLLFDSIKGKVAVPFEREQFEWGKISLVSPFVSLGAGNMCMTYNIHTLAKIDKKPVSSFRLAKDTLFVLSSADFNKTTEKALEILLKEAKINKVTYSKICVISTKHLTPKEQIELKLDKISSYKLDDFYKFMDAKERRKALTKTLFFKITKAPLCGGGDSLSYAKSEFYRSSIAEFEEDKGKKAYVFLYDDKSPVYEKSEKGEITYTTNSLGFLASYTGYSIYGFKLSQVSVEKVKEILEEEGAIQVNDLIIKEVEKFDQNTIDNVYSYNMMKSNYYSEIKIANLYSKKFNQSFSDLVSHENEAKSTESKDKFNSALNLYLENSPKEIREYFDLLFRYNTEIENTQKIWFLLKMFGAKGKVYGKDFVSKDHLELTEKLKKYKTIFDERYTDMAYLITTYSYKPMLKAIHMLDALVKHGYTVPKVE